MTMICHEARHGLAEGLRSLEEARAYRAKNPRCEHQGCGEEGDQTLTHKEPGRPAEFGSFCKDHIPKGRWWEDRPARTAPAQATRTAPAQAPARTESPRQRTEFRAGGRHVPARVRAVLDPPGRPGCPDHIAGLRRWD
jgi:hypothetical protein